MAERRDWSGSWLAWVDEGTTLVDQVLDTLGDAGLAAAVELPGWTRAHVLAHLVGNARSHLNLMTWARTGIETPAYSSPEARAAEIEDLAALPASELRALWSSTAAQWRSAYDELPPETRDAELAAGGARLRARQLPWLRAREVMVHSVDLGGVVTWDSLPPDFLRALLDNVVRERSRKGLDPALELRAGEDAWTVEGAGAPTPLASTLGGLAEYATGRLQLGASGRAVALPPLTPWL